MNDKHMVAAAAAVLLLVLLAKRKSAQAAGVVPGPAQLQRDAWVQDFMGQQQRQEAEFRAGMSLRFDPADFAGALGN